VNAGVRTQDMPWRADYERAVPSSCLPLDLRFTIESAEISAICGRKAVGSYPSQRSDVRVRGLALSDVVELVDLYVALGEVGDDAQLAAHGGYESAERADVHTGLMLQPGNGGLVCRRATEMRYWPQSTQRSQSVYEDEK
jgi:hypothetical protein